MLGWAITFLVIALIAALFGFGGIAGVAVEAAKIVFFVAIVLFVVSALFGVFRGRRFRNQDARTGGRHRTFCRWCGGGVCDRGFGGEKCRERRQPRKPRFRNAEFLSEACERGTCGARMICARVGA